MSYVPILDFVDFVFDSHRCLIYRFKLYMWLLLVSNVVATWWSRHQQSADLSRLDALRRAGKSIRASRTQIVLYHSRTGRASLLLRA